MFQLENLTYIIIVVSFKEKRSKRINIRVFNMFRGLKIAQHNSQLHLPTITQALQYEVQPIEQTYPSSKLNALKNQSL